MHPFNAAQPPRLAILLGYAGLIPFISGAIGIWITPTAWRADVLTALLHYAAVILAFMGAIHWGLAMARERKTFGKRLALRCGERRGDERGRKEHE